MITHYTAITLISAFAMLIMLVCVQNSQFILHDRKRYFQALFLLILLTDLSEWLAAALIGAEPGWRGLHIAAKFWELLLTPFVPFVAMSAATGRRTPFWCFLPVCLNVVLQIASLATGCVFSIDDANAYTRGPMYLVYCALFIFEAVLLVACCLRLGRQYQFANVWFLLLINLLVLLAVFMEFYAPYLRLDWACVSYATILFFIYCEQLVQQVDATTGLLSRRSFRCAVQQIRKPVTVIFFDVDRFKEVNDVYGHKFGDTCLFAAAQAVREVFGHYGYCYRYGGDEFCVILYREQAQIDSLISAYHARLQARREKEPHIPFVSTGYAVFDCKNETISDAVHRADQMMYQYKQQRRERQG